MRKQRKMEYEAPQVAEIDLLLTEFMGEVIDTGLEDMKVTGIEDDDFWNEN